MRLHPPLLDTEYGFCPKYTIKAGDTLFQIAQELNVTQGVTLLRLLTSCGCRLSGQEGLATQSNPGVGCVLNQSCMLVPLVCSNCRRADQGRH
jgi:hypothetical protein